MYRNTIQLGLIYPSDNGEQVAEERQRAENFGLFEVTEPGVMDPNTDPEDAVPSEEDYFRVPFRLLSETIVAAYTNRATDFSDADLQGSMQKLVGKTVFAEHEGYVGNQLGVVESVEWQDEATDENGVRIPAGIKGVLKLDGRANPKTVRSLLADPPEIYSASVTIDFHWEPSHSLDSFDNLIDFEDSIGSIDEESGRMITRKVTDIVDYYEVSLIHLGADPFAKILTDEESPHNIDMSRIRDEEGFSVGNMRGQEFRALHSSGTFRALHSYRLDKHSQTTPKNPSSMNKEAFQALISLMGYDNENAALEAFGISKVEELTKEHLAKFRLTSEKDGGGDTESLKKELEDKKKRVSELRASSEKLQSELEGKKEELQKLSTIGDKVKEELQIESDENFTSTEVAEQLHSMRLKAEKFDGRIEQLRKDTRDLYKKSLQEGSEPDQEMLEIIDQADPAKLQSLAKTFGDSATEKFSATCQECGSTKVSMRSSQESDEGEKPTEGKTLDQLREEYGSDKMFPGKEN